MMRDLQARMEKLEKLTYGTNDMIRVLKDKYHDTYMHIGHKLRPLLDILEDVEEDYEILLAGASQALIDRIARVE